MYKIIEDALKEEIENYIYNINIHKVKELIDKNLILSNFGKQLVEWRNFNEFYLNSLAKYIYKKDMDLLDLYCAYISAKNLVNDNYFKMNNLVPRSRPAPVSAGYKSHLKEKLYNLFNEIRSPKIEKKPLYEIFNCIRHYSH